MSSKSGHTMYDIKMLFIQWMIEHFVIPEIKDLGHENDFVILHSLINLPRIYEETVTDKIKLVTREREFAFISQPEHFSIELIASLFSDPNGIAKVLIVSNVTSSKKLKELMDFYISAKKILGLEHVFILDSEGGVDLHLPRSIVEINLNQIHISDQATNNFFDVLINSLDMLFYKSNQHRSLFQLKRYITQSPTARELKASYYGFVYLIDFYFQNGYLHDNLYDGYYDYLSSVLHCVLKALNFKDKKNKLFHYNYLSRLMQSAAITSQFENGGWVLHPQKFATDRQETDIYKAIKFNTSLWHDIDNKIYWSENSIRDYWAADYLAEKIVHEKNIFRAADFFANKFSESSFFWEFLVGRISRKFLKPEIAAEIMKQLHISTKARQNQLVYNCIKTAGINVLGLKRVAEILQMPISNLQTQDESKLIGVL